MIGGTAVLIALRWRMNVMSLPEEEARGRDLTIGYPDRTVGHGLDVALATGEVLALLGPNGGGKTTLLKTLLGLLRPKAGEVAPGAGAGRRLCSASAYQHLRVCR
jgi:ABC-type cobalamin/Fe3+-siderophores transport system ATPase subunit